MEFNFQWDPNKDHSNQKKHGVSFLEATEVFKDPMALTLFDQEHSLEQERWVTLGLTPKGQYLVIVHTFDEYENGVADLRIISARKATKQEIKQYEKENL